MKDLLPVSPRNFGMTYRVLPKKLFLLAIRLEII